MEREIDYPNEYIDALARQIEDIGGERLALLARGFIRQDFLFGQAATVITTMGVTLDALGKPDLGGQASNTANRLSKDFMELSSSLVLDALVQVLHDDNKADAVYELMRKMQRLSRDALKDDVEAQVNAAMKDMAEKLAAVEGKSA